MSGGSVHRPRSVYFDEETIDETASGMLEPLLSMRRPVQFLKETSALLVIDMQRYFTEEASHAFIPSIRPAIKNITTLAEGFHKVGRPVYLTRHLNTLEDAGMLGRWWADMIVREDPFSEITSELEGIGTVIEKNRYDAFAGTGLEEMMRRDGCESVIITGVATHLCCETTARSAFVRDFEVFMPLDATATYTEDFHRSAMLNLAHGFATPVLTSEVINWLG